MSNVHGAEDAEPGMGASVARVPSVGTTQHTARQVELLDRIAALIRREGPFVSMEQIAAACGVTKPIIYRHFGDRDGVVHALAGTFVDRLIHTVGSELDSGAPALDLLVATLDAYLALIEEDQNIYRFLYDHAGAHRDLMVGLVADRITMVVERELAMRELPLEPARSWANAMVGMVHLAGDRWVDDRSISRAELVEHLTMLLWFGFDGLGLGAGPARTADDLPLTSDRHVPRSAP